MLPVVGGRKKVIRPDLMPALKKTPQGFLFFAMLLMSLLLVNPAGLMAVPLPPQNLHVVDGGGTETTLAWDPNSDADLAGYVVYWDIKSGPPYDNPIDVGDVITYTLTELPEGVIYSAVTAYDLEGHESGFSEEISFNTVPIPPSIILLGTGVLGLVLVGWRRKRS